MKASRFKLAILRWLLRSKPIYDICSALRGPDQFHDTTEDRGAYYDLKANTTGIVRAKLGLSEKRKGQSSLLVTTYDGSPHIRRHTRPKGSTHFIEHQEAAFRSLGLDWYNCNGDVRP